MPPTPTPTRAELITAIERGLFLYEDVPGLATPVRVPGVRGAWGRHPHPFANGVAADGLAPEAADGTIAAVLAEAAARGNGVAWVVGPSGGPADLAARLERHGFARAIELAGMATAELASGPPAPAVGVRPARPEELRRHAAALARAFGMPEDHLHHDLDLRERSGGEPRAVTYLAFVDGVEGPVGFGHLFWLPGTAIVQLGGAGTLAEHRGRGVYTALVRRRLADARAAGATAAVIQADRATSAPICAGLGFEELCALEIWAWTPPGAGDAPRA